MKRWVTRPADEAAADRLAAKLNLARPVARVLAGRGLGDPDAASRFLRPELRSLSDPMELPGMAAAAEAIWSAIRAGRTIAVYGDYDVDGLTATALLTDVLRGLGARAEPFLPSRMEDGYGLNPHTLDKCVERHRPGFLVTVDCGTNATAAADRARELGLDLVITDHHQPSGPVAAAVAVVNPRLAAPGAPWSDIAGVGVAFKLAHALVKMGRSRGHPAAEGLASSLRQRLDLVALGTVSDCVPLLGENRVMVRHGLPLLDQPAGPGLRALRDVGGVRGTTTTYHVGFVLGPRLNASGRIGTAEAALELLMTGDARRARELAGLLDEANRKRQRLEKRIFDEARAIIDARSAPELQPAIVVESEGWHPGVIGIVASRLCAFYSRPTVVIALEGGCGRGSCRSLEGVNLVECLEDCRPALRRCGGHAMAAGLEVDRERVDEFRRLLIEAVGRRVRVEDLCATQRVDAWLSLDEADERLLTGAETLRPCGQGHPEPVWAVRGVRLRHPRRVGERHLRVEVEQGKARRAGIAFNQWDREVPEGLADVAFELKENTWNGNTTLQLQIRDFRPASGA